jgi:ABC-type amino acid transport substrate-binding protein
MVKLTWGQIGIIIILAIIVSIAINLILAKPTNTEIQEEQTLRDAVLERGTIRAAYIVTPPRTIKDPNTGRLSGISVDAFEEAAGLMNLKVEWVEEVSWATFLEGLKTDRYDVVASGIWPTASRGKQADFSVPIMYSVVHAYVRVDDTRFDQDLGLINSPNIKISTIDGEAAELIADAKFPQAQQLALPQMSSLSEMMLNVVNNKAMWLLLKRIQDPNLWLKILIP